MENEWNFLRSLKLSQNIEVNVLSFVKLKLSDHHANTSDQKFPGGTLEEYPLLPPSLTHLIIYQELFRKPPDVKIVLDDLDCLSEQGKMVLYSNKFQTYS